MSSMFLLLLLLVLLLLIACCSETGPNDVSTSLSNSLIVFTRDCLRSAPNCPLLNLGRFQSDTFVETLEEKKEDKDGKGLHPRIILVQPLLRLGRKIFDHGKTLIIITLLPSFLSCRRIKPYPPANLYFPLPCLALWMICPIIEG